MTPPHSDPSPWQGRWPTRRRPSHLTLKHRILAVFAAGGLVCLFLFLEISWFDDDDHQRSPFVGIVRGGAGGVVGAHRRGDRRLDRQQQVHDRVAGLLEATNGTYPGGMARIFTDDTPIFSVADPYTYWFNHIGKSENNLCPVVRELTGVYALGVDEPSYIRYGTPAPVLDVAFNCTDLIKHGLGTGNWIVAFYNTRIIAALARVDLLFTCTEGVGPEHETLKRNVLPWLQGYYPAPTVEEFGEGAWPFDGSKLDVMIAACTTNYATQRLDVLARTIQGDMRRMAVALVGPREEKHRLYQVHPPPSLFPGVDLDDAVIHFRCGDILGAADSTCHGLVKYSTYSKVLPEDVRTIGVVTQPFEVAANRENDRNTVEPCRRAVSKLVDVLEAAFPNAVVSVRNGEGETMALQYARLVMAKQTIASPSTFGTFPSIGTFGEGYFIDGLHREGIAVAPFVRRIAKGPNRLENFHVVKAPLLVATRIRQWGIDRTMDWVVDDLEQDAAEV